MSELEMIGQRLGERLLTSGLLSSVKIERQAKSLVLVLTPAQGLVLSDRAMRFCLNFLGEQSKRPERRNIFVWCASYIEDISPHTCRVWIDCDRPCGYMGFDVIAELILLGIKTSQSLGPSPSSYSFDELLQVYRKKEDVLAFYEGFISQVIRNGDDLPTEECETSLRDVWLCCPKHRFLFVQRLLLNGWLHHIFWKWDPSEEDDTVSDTEQVYQTPSSEEMKKRFFLLLGQRFTAQKWLQARFEQAKEVEQRHWELPTPHCQRKHHVAFACCPFHSALQAESYLFTTWLEHFDDTYHMSEVKDKQGHAPGLFSIYGMALFIHLAKLDTSDISFTGWFEGVPSVDISIFHLERQQ